MHYVIAPLARSLDMDELKAHSSPMPTVRAQQEKQMNRAKTTKFLFQDGDYFVALTDEPGVRIGMVGGTCYDVPRGHAYYDRICEADTRRAVEDYHDELTSAYAYA